MWRESRRKWSGSRKRKWRLKREKVKGEKKRKYSEEVDREIEGAAE